MTRITALFMAAISILLIHSPAYAAEQPSSTTAKYADWAVRCNLTSSEADSTTSDTLTKVCEMIQIIRITTPNKANASQILAQIAIGKLPEASKFKIIFQLPNGVYLRQPITLKLNDLELLLEASYIRCNNDGCFADAELTMAQISSLKSAEKAEFSFADGAQRDINIPFSLNGFSGAFEAIIQ